MTRDLMYQEEIKESVRQAYSRISAGGGEGVAHRLYGSSELAEVPVDAIVWALGVGNPVRYAFVEAGETILDIGSGGGIDTILAAKRTGSNGKAIGLDILEEMGNRGRRHAVEAGVSEWTEFIQGEMEAIPLESGWVDLVISNGVINLSGRKSRTLAEIFRVLKPGGRLCVADLTVENDLPSEVANDPSAWAG
ncbi:MAG TPA: methyltransferase domain-containing protein [Acidimicrobiia bacterium]|nr:methyltransferase domain-containing protein [Acidimicrobiia bacterium]